MRQLIMKKLGWRMNMLYYLLALMADVGIVGCFALGKVYSQRVPGDMRNIFGKTALMALMSAAIFFAINGGMLEVNGFTMVMSVAMAVISLLSSAVCFMAYQCGALSLFTMFQMLGGMLLPFLYGVFCGDELTVPRIAGILMMSLGLILTVRREGDERQSRKFVLLCLSIFLINGMMSIISFIYTNDVRTAGPNSFIVIKSLLTALFAGVIWRAACVSTDGAQPTAKEKGVLLGLIFATCVMDSAGYFLQLLAAAHLSSMVLYPVVTGGSLVLTAIVGRGLFGEKQSRRAIAGIALAFLATVMFAF